MPVLNIIIAILIVSNEKFTIAKHEFLALVRYDRCQISC